MDARRRAMGMFGRALAGALLVLATAAQASAEVAPVWRLSFEVLSSLHALPPEARRAPYEEKEKLARAALAEIVPHVWTTLGAQAARARSRVRPGGYRDEINPSIQSALTTSEGEARRLAAAFGYVFRQWAVLMHERDAGIGEHRYVSVRFPRGVLNHTVAERFFARARAQLASDKLGFYGTATRMIFINLGTGIPEADFADGLGRAAADLPDVGITVDRPAPVRAALIENDWDKARNGEDYVRHFGPNGERLAAALAQLRRRHDQRVLRWAAMLSPPGSSPHAPRPAPHPRPAPSPEPPAR